MGQYDSLMRCTLGVADFQLQNYSVQVTPNVVTNIGRVGSSVTVKGTGFMQAASAAALGADLTSLSSAGIASGQTFSIYGLSDTLEFQLTPAQCVEGGPHLGFTIENQSEAFIKPISFELTAKTALVISGVQQSGYTETVTTRPDGTMSVERDGTIIGTAVTVPDALAAFQAVYPPANWVISYKSSSNNFGLNVTYQFTATQLLEPYPDAGSNSTAQIVDGELNIRTDRDEQSRVATAYDYDLLVIGDYTQVVTRIRADSAADQAQQFPVDNTNDTGDESIIVRESVSVSVFKQVRVRASFSFLRGGDGNRLMNWTQTIDLVDDNDSYAVQPYVGADAVLIKQPDHIARVTQSGTATGLGDFYQPPDPILTDAFLEQPKITLQHVNVLECQTTWLYVMAADDGFDLSDYTDQLDRPTSPTFYDD